MASTNDQPQLWFSSSGKKLEEVKLGYYDSSAFPWAENVEKNAAAIQEEVARFIQNHSDRIQPYFNTSMVSGQDKWKAFGFKFWTWPFPENIKECPETMRILASVPNLLSASVSILGPKTEIHPHKGDTNAIYRCHLGLKVPGVIPECGFMVNEEKRSWEEGKLLIFNDAADHAAWNNTDEIRYLLLFDVLRPEFISKKYYICSRVLSGIRMQMLRQKRPLITKFPKFVRRLIASVQRMIIASILRIRKSGK